MTLVVAIEQGVIVAAAISSGNKMIDSIVNHSLLLSLKWSS